MNGRHSVYLLYFSVNEFQVIRYFFDRNMMISRNYLKVELDLHHQQSFKKIDQLCVFHGFRKNFLKVF